VAPHPNARACFVGLHVRRRAIDHSEKGRTEFTRSATGPNAARTECPASEATVNIRAPSNIRMRTSAIKPQKMIALVGSPAGKDDRPIPLIGQRNVDPSSRNFLVQVVRPRKCVFCNRSPRTLTPASEIPFSLEPAAAGKRTTDTALFLSPAGATFVRPNK